MYGVIVIPLSECFQLLGLNSNATVFEIKKAYREKAKKLHPDKCADKDAAEKFIRITEAYEILIDYRQKGINPLDIFKKRANYQKEQAAAREAEAKRKAKHAARMKYQQFLQSDYFKTNLYIDILVDHFVFLIAFFAFVILPFLLVREMGAFGFVPWSIVIAFTSPFLIKPLLNLKNFNLKDLWKAMYYIGKKKRVLGTLFFAGFMLIFFLVIFRTIIPHNLYFISLGVFMLISFLFTRRTKKTRYNKHPFFYSLLVAPFLFNSFFLVNYVVSFPVKSETYAYTYESHIGRTKSGGKDVYAITVYFENNEYEHCGMLRIFYGGNYPGKKLELKISRGIFGLRVVKKFDFLSD